jgi:hypothetical protein
MHAYPNFFYSINLLGDKLYDAIHHGKKGRKKEPEKSEIWKKNFLGKIVHHEIEFTPTSQSTLPAFTASNDKYNELF